MRAAQAAVSRIYSEGVTSEQMAQAQAELQAMNAPRQPQLALKVRR